jgi:predicted dehydrogenase
VAEDLRVALIGYGLGGRVFHAPLIAATPGLRVVTIVTSNPDRRAQAAQAFPAAHIAESADWVWANARAHDLAVITTTNRTHVPLARAAVAAGLAVVVDKPMAASSSEARALVAEAKQRGVPITAYHNRRWDGEVLTAQKIIGSGVLGRVTRFEARLDRWRPTINREAWRESGATEEAGGILFDLGPHLIDQARVLFGPVTRLYSEIDRQRTDVQVEDDVFIALRHASGVYSHLWTTSVSAQPGPRMRLMGTKAAYTKQHADTQESVLRAGKPASTPGFGEDPPERWGLLGAEGNLQPVRTEKGNFQRFYELTVPWLREGAPPPVDPMDAVVVLELIEAARRSAAEGRTIQVDDVAL